MKAIVLVGGEGTRLRPLTYTTPKPLLPIANVAFLERQLQWLAAGGVDEVILSLGYMPDAFLAHFPEGRYGGISLRYVVEEHPLGTAGGIRFAASGLHERLLVCNGDVLTDLDLVELLRFHEEREAEATIALTKVEDPSAFGVVPTRSDGSVLAFVEKPPHGKAPTNWINAGTYVLEPSVLDRIPPRVNVSIERETFPRMLERPGHLFAMRSDAYWLDIGTPAKYLQGHADVLDGLLGKPPTADAEEIQPGVWAQGDVDIEPGAQLEGPVLLGEGSVVRTGARIAHSTLGQGVVVGHGTRVLRSVLLDGVVVDADAEVRDSVVGTRAVLESDVVLTERTVVGEQVVVSSGSQMSAARVSFPEHRAGVTS